ncbi:hypothetical protein [Thermoanaerobacterium sp. DL9XJH110]
MIKEPRIRIFEDRPYRKGMPEEIALPLQKMADDSALDSNIVTL